MSVTSTNPRTRRSSGSTGRVFWIRRRVPNRFRDDEEMGEEPKSPRRFPKAALDTMLREPMCGRGLLLLLLSLRRRASDLDKSANEGAPTSSYCWKVRFPKSGPQFQRGRTRKNQCGTMEIEAAVAPRRARLAAAPLATYEYQTLPAKGIRIVPALTFGELSYEGGSEIIAGRRLRPSGTKARCRSYSRVGMAEERAASRPSYVQRRNSDRTYAEKGRRGATIDYYASPKTPRQVVKHWRKYGPLPQEMEGWAAGITHHAEVRGPGKRGSGALRDLCS